MLSCVPGLPASVIALLTVMALILGAVFLLARLPSNSSRESAFLPSVEAMSVESQIEAARFADHASWETVESFTDLRRRQADLLRL